MPENLLEQLKSDPECLSKSERKVAEVILKDPNVAIRSSIASLARAASVSEPTVNRFCRSMGCSGFPDFKLHLAQCLVKGTPYVSNSVEEQDSPADYTRKIFEATLSTLAKAQTSMDSTAISQAVDVLTAAHKIEFYGLGGSGPVALDAQHKFFRLNAPAIAHTDMLMQRMSASATGKGDAVVCISNTGRTISLIETAKLAKQAGATLIGITTPDSPLSEICDITLGVESSENTDIYTPMTSRIVQLVVIDVLATGVSLKNGPEFREHLKRIKNSVLDTRYQKKEI